MHSTIHIGKKYRITLEVKPIIGSAVECLHSSKDISCIEEGKLGKIVNIKDNKYTILLLCGHLWIAKSNQFRIIPIEKYEKALNERYKWFLGERNESI